MLKTALYHYNFVFLLFYRVIFKQKYFLPTLFFLINLNLSLDAFVPIEIQLQLAKTPISQECIAIIEPSSSYHPIHPHRHSFVFVTRAVSSVKNVADFINRSLRYAAFIEIYGHSSLSLYIFEGWSD